MSITLRQVSYKVGVGAVTRDSIKFLFVAIQCLWDGKCTPHSLREIKKSL